MIRLFTLLGLIFTLAACENSDINSVAKKDLGDFVLVHNIVVAPDVVKGPLSREASAEDWITSVRAAVGERLGRYDGDRRVHLGINVAGYMLAVPGVPIVASPKSALIISVTVWDDGAGRKFHSEPQQLIVTESTSGKTFIGSGLTSSAEEQMEDLSRNAARLIEVWLAQNADCMRGEPDPSQPADCWQEFKGPRPLPPIADGQTQLDFSGCNNYSARGV